MKYYILTFLRELTLIITILKLGFDQQSTKSTGFLKRISASDILVLIKNLVNLGKNEVIDCVEISLKTET